MQSLGGLNYSNESQFFIVKSVASSILLLFHELCQIKCIMSLKFS